MKTTKRFSYLMKSDLDIVEDINNDRVPDDVLDSREEWSRICSARGRNFHKINEEAWRELCKRRGYLRYRRNPRGF